MSICFVVSFVYTLFFFFKQKTAYEMRISDWSSDVCSSDLQGLELVRQPGRHRKCRLIDLDQYRHFQSAEPRTVLWGGRHAVDCSLLGSVCGQAHHHLP